MKDICISEEYVETVCEWLESWKSKKKSWTIPQFLKEHGIGWTYFKAMMEVSPQIHHTFETVIAHLHSKWLDYAMRKEKMPFHMQKVLMKYLSVYDNHAYQVEQESKKELAERTKISIANYDTEDYSKERLRGLYKRLYDDNVNKSRNRKPSK